MHCDRERIAVAVAAVAAVVVPLAATPGATILL